MQMLKKGRIAKITINQQGFVTFFCTDGEFLTFVAKQAAQSQAESMQLKKKYLPKGGRR